MSAIKHIILSTPLGNGTPFLNSVKKKHADCYVSTVIDFQTGIIPIFHKFLKLFFSFIFNVFFSALNFVGVMYI
jgi:hypothetical protein